jgi:isopenicillin-N epimerase
VTLSNRRSFLGATASLAAATATLMVPPFVRDADALESWLRESGGSLQDPRSDDAVARDEAYWGRVRKLYSLQPNVLNFDNGWTNPTPSSAIEELERSARKLEGLPAEHLPGMWEGISNTQLRSALATAMHVPGTQLALLRNATEALDTVLLGFPLRAGDEVVCSKHDYYAMLDALEQRRARDGIVLRIIEPPIPATPDVLFRLYDEAINERTRLVLVAHPSNLTGQLLPVRRIAERARAAGAKVVVDGAQSLGLLEDPIRSLDCDFYGASAHKWLGTPVGLGVLWMKPGHVEKVWPLIPAPATLRDMGRFEWIGTAPEYLNVASLPALALHSELGAARKAARLRYLAGLLRSRLGDSVSRLRFYAATDMTLGLTTFEVDGADSSKLQESLRKNHGILVQAMTGIRSDARIKGIRVSPNVYATPAEVARFVSALATEARRLRG